MKLAIMQPYFVPYLGYFQLLNAVDEFVIYDNIQFTKKGWINRNRILVNGTDEYLSIPLKRDSDYLNIDSRYLAETWATEKNKLLNRLHEAYKKAPYYNLISPIIEGFLNYNAKNLFDFIFHSINQINRYLSIKTNIIVSSSLNIDHGLKAEKKVIEICKNRGAKTYINPIGGKTLYQKEDFRSTGLDLYFLQTNKITYPQFDNAFVASLSILDVMMFNSPIEIRNMLNQFELL